MIVVIMYGLPGQEKVITKTEDEQMFQFSPGNKVDYTKHWLENLMSILDKIIRWVNKIKWRQLSKIIHNRIVQYDPGFADCICFLFLV